MYLRQWHASDLMQSKQWRQNIFCKQDSGSHLIHRKSSSDLAGFVQSSSSITPASHTCSSNQHDFFWLHTCFAEVCCNKQGVLAHALLGVIISKFWVCCLLTKWCCWAGYCWTRNSHAYYLCHTRWYSYRNPPDSHHYCVLIPLLSLGVVVAPRTVSCCCVHMHSCTAGSAAATAAGS